MDSSYINCKNQKVKWCWEENVCYFWFWILLNAWVLLATRMDPWTELNTLTWTLLLPGFSLILWAVPSLSDHWPHKPMWTALVSAMWFSEQSFLDSTPSCIFFIYTYVVLQESKNFLMICTKYYFLSWSLGGHILMDLREAICGRRSNQVNPKGRLWILIGRNGAEAKAPILWPPDEKSRPTGKDPGEDRRQEEKRVAGDEMVR